MTINIHQFSLCVYNGHLNEWYIDAENQVNSFFIIQSSQPKKNFSPDIYA